MSIFQRLRQKLSSLRAQKQYSVQRDHNVKVIQQLRGKRFPRVYQVLHIKKLFSDGERQLFNISAALFAVGCIWIVGAFLQAYRIEVPAVGGEYREAIVGSPQLVNPLFASVNDVDMDVSRLLFRGLMRYDESQQLVTDLASSYDISDDQLTYTFTLRDDAYWHPLGEEKNPELVSVTAEDVAFTFELIADETVGSPLLRSFGEGVLVEARDERTVVFTLSEVYPAFVESLTVGILPAHIWEQIPAEQIRLAQYNVQPIGNGPFQFDSLVKNDAGFIREFRVKRFADFYDQPAYIESVSFVFFDAFDGDTGAIAALRRQEVDGIHFVPADLKEKAERKHLNIHTIQLPQYSALFFNQKNNAWLEDKEVREALALGLDKERILRESLQGEGLLIDGPILPGFPGYKEDLTVIPYALSKANELLDAKTSRVASDVYREEQIALRFEEAKTDAIDAADELRRQDTVSSSSEFLFEESAGVEEASLVSTTLSAAQEDLIREQVEAIIDDEVHTAQLFYRRADEDSPVMEINLVSADTAEYRQAAGLIAGFWEELGIKTNVRLVDPKRITKDVLRTREYDILLFGIVMGSDPDQYPVWHSNEVAYPGLNLSQYVNRNVDELLEKIRQGGDAPTQVSLYREMEDILLAERAAIFLYSPIYRYAVSDKLYGFSIDRVFHPADRFAGVTNWYLKTDGTWGKANKEE